MIFVIWVGTKLHPKVTKLIGINKDIWWFCAIINDFMDDQYVSVAIIMVILCGARYNGKISNWSIRGVIGIKISCPVGEGDRNEAPSPKQHVSAFVYESLLEYVFGLESSNNLKDWVVVFLEVLTTDILLHPSPFWLLFNDYSDACSFLPHIIVPSVYGWW